VETFPLEKFRILYPAFAAVADLTVTTVAESAACYIGLYCTDCDEQGWMLLVAHMLALRAMAESGNGVAPGAVQSATIGSVSVSFQAAPTSDSWSFWLTQTPYGQQLLALVDACFGGAQYVGGLGERAAFRSVGGAFPLNGRSPRRW
jgi:hypothetical protein